MKNKFSNGRLSYVFTPRIHGNVLAWVKPASESERSKRVTENILRWEDDGGWAIEVAKPADNFVLSMKHGQKEKPNE